MLIYHQQASYYVKRLAQDFELGDVVKLKEIDSIRKELYENHMKRLIPVLVALAAVTANDSKKQVQSALTKVNVMQAKVYKLLTNPDATNGMLQELVLELTDFARDTLYVMKDEIELEPWVEDKTQQRFPRNVLKQVAKKFHASRDICVFENDMNEGEDLLAFKHNMQTHHNVVLYGKDKSVESCNTARQNGVDYVAKVDLYSVTHRCFDFSMNFLDEYTFFQEEYERTFYLKEEEKFGMLFNRNIPADDGFVLLNLPYFKIPELEKKLTYYITIDDIYRVDDPIKNVLIVARKRKNKGQNEAKLRKALLMYQSLPSISDMKEYFINKGEFNPPKVFKPYFVDEDDVMEEFKTMPTPIDILEEIYTPVERIVELSNPLQEIKEGHYPAVATSEITNGINDTEFLKPILGKDLDFVHMFCTKIIQQDVQEVNMVMHNGKEIEEVSEKKMNFIVSNLWTQDGEFIELLDTEKENQKDEGVSK